MMVVGVIAGMGRGISGKGEVRGRGGGGVDWKPELEQKLVFPFAARFLGPLLLSFSILLTFVLFLIGRRDDKK